MTQGPTAKARRLVVGLDEVGRDDLELAGGKGANLGELIGAGFKVPPGFVATTAAYHRFVELNALQAVVERGHRDGNMGAVRAAFESAPIPDEVGREIRQAYEQLGRGPVAVRSSATADRSGQIGPAGATFRSPAHGPGDDLPSAGRR
jgi:phosphoenolpyruvate synthase/pyruvate phosphate dikinase